MRLAAALLCLLAFSGEAQAKALCVNGSTGSDATTYAANNGTSTCWQTIGRAAWGSTTRSSPNTAEAAAAGDVVTIAAGTYTTAGIGGRFDVAYDPANNGTSGNLITFQCASAGACILQLSSSSGPVIGCAGSDYIKWDGFYIDEANAAPIGDTGPVVFNAAEFCELHNTEINGITTAFGDNHNGVRIEGSQHTLIRNNTIYEIGDDGGYGQNSAAVMLYDANDSVIEHNHFYTSGVGVFVKGQHPGETQRRTIIRYNLITDIRYAGLDLLADYQGRHYQNIIRDCGATGIGVKIYALGPGEGGEPTQVFVVNNTIDDCAIGIDLQGQGADNEVHNNLITTNDDGLGAEGAIGAPLTGLSFERNLYFGNSNMARFDRDGSNPTYTLATWQSTYSEDPNGSSADPDYVNAAGNDFHLDVGSPALTLGRVVQSIGGTNGDTIPAGAYITGSETIGIDAGGATVPDAPTIGTATAGNAQCVVTFTPPGDDGGATITGYTATSSPSSITGTAASSPITVTGLSNGTGYTFTVVATNSQGNSSASSVSNSCTPVAVTGAVRVRRK